MSDDYEHVAKETSIPSLYGIVNNNIKAIIRLSSPIIVSRTGILLIVTSDTLMVGNFSSTELAYQAIGLAVIIPLLLGSLGLIMGTMVISANAFGAGEYANCGAAWRRSILYALLLGIIGCGVGWFGEPILKLLGQSSDLAAGGGKITLIIGLGLPPNLLFLSTMLFLESIKRPMPGMVLMIIANILNILLNYFFIYGTALSSPMGAEGAAWATTVSRVFLCISIVSYVWWMRDHDLFAVRIKPTGDFYSWRAQRRIGYATGISIGIESLSFAALNVFAGWLGPLVLASYTIAFNLIALVFMFATGLGTATAVLVGIAYGQKNLRGMAWAGWTGLALNTVIMLLFGIIFYFFPSAIAHFYSSDKAVISILVPLISLSAFIITLDGGQAVISNALRGRRDVWVPSLIQFFSFFVIMVAAAHFLAFTDGQAEIGLFKGVIIGAMCSIFLHGTRFYWLIRKDKNAF